MSAAPGERAAAPLRVLLVDDEPLVRRGLRTFLAAEPGVEVVGECRDGREALGAVRELSPDVMFLDVQMPELDGFGVLDALGPGDRPAVVFVTAFDAYAIRAFDVHAVDYLLKPFDEPRFRTALERARERVAARRGAAAGVASVPHDPSRVALDALLAQLRGDGRVAGDWLARIAVRETDRVTYVPVADVDWLEADDNYVRVHTRGGARLVRETLKALEARLDPRRFARIHRSAIVNLERVRELRPTFNGEYVVVLATGTRLTLSRGYRDAFFDRMGKG
ncbi:LytTr DNA-binding region [Gemmatirosa kalamazoonensis]|uniref:LytTr DNA-binding region n=1 Tax=Gemmatirosa kalamazoonensis TaxID=861299 RepID=W0RJP2_9BACT|nr:LytTR family DNA-binding domain-containing protein [Gemmatirosa kalamazoonensis]AHG89633.1 LytTr DNA-binding region [Gemmatirosa kalamazoonensis]